MLKSMFAVALLGVCTTCGLSSQEAPAPAPASCAGSVQASCSGSQAVSTREVILRRAPVRTFLKNRPQRLRSLFQVRTSCSG